VNDRDRTFSAQRGLHTDPPMRYTQSMRFSSGWVVMVDIAKFYDSQVGDIWGGLMVRNSGVGFASLQMIAFLVRLVCRNGLCAPLPDAVLLRRRHRGLDDSRLRGDAWTAAVAVARDAAHGG